MALYLHSRNVNNGSLALYFYSHNVNNESPALYLHSHNVNNEPLPRDFIFTLIMSTMSRDHGTLSSLS